MLSTEGRSIGRPFCLIQTHKIRACATPGDMLASVLNKSGLIQSREQKLMAPEKKILAKRQAWNKGLEIGKRDGFTPAQVKRIRGLLADRGVPGLRDLALFSTAVDTMLHGQ